MSLDFLRDCTLVGPAFPEPFVRFELETELSKAGLLPKASGPEARLLEESWTTYRRKLRELVRGGSIRIRNHVIEPLIERLGYARLENAPNVDTREGQEDGGDLLVLADGSAHLRVWCTEFDEDLEAPSMRGSAYRYSRIRIAQRVLLACGERLGLLTNGTELRLLISDPARPDSQIVINIDPSWKDKRSFQAPDSYRLLIAMASPRGVKAIPDLVEKARLQQTRVTKELRRQAREAVDLFLQEVLDNRPNQTKLAELRQQPHFARELWREALVVVYRLLFILKLEATDDPARSFSFASSGLWRSTFSPSVALPDYVRSLLDRNMPTGSLLEQGLRGLFRMFVEGLDCTELHVRPLGGTLFGEKVTPLLSNLAWGEHAVAYLLDRLLWASPKRGSGRERVHYGSLDVEDLGRVYEALLELEPGIASEPMCRLRRSKLEVVVPVGQGEKYRPAEAAPVADGDDQSEDELEEDEPAEEESEGTSRGGKTKVEWIEEIRAGRFYLRVGLGRKATGSYYTPHSFVRFLVQETLGPLVAERSPKSDPSPAQILKLKVLDPAMGSGHFLVEACRYLGSTLYEAARLCDERLADYEKTASAAQNAQDKTFAEAEAAKYRERLQNFVPPDAELLAYLPSRSPEASESGLSQKRAEAICRRLVAVHCLYGVDKNPLAVELAKVSLWIESHSEGLPLTFLDHRLVLGDSITGPFFHHLLTYPGSQLPMEDLYTQGLAERLRVSLSEAITLVKDIESTLGASIGDVAAKQSIRLRLDAALAPFKIIGAAWAGGVMFGSNGCDDEAYKSLVDTVARTGSLPAMVSNSERLLKMIARGLEMEQIQIDTVLPTDLTDGHQAIPAFCHDLSFPEVFYPDGDVTAAAGFHAVLGNPPWDTITIKRKEWFAAFDFEVLNARNKADRSRIEQIVLLDEQRSHEFGAYVESFEQRKRINDALFRYQKVKIDGDLAGRFLDEFRLFMERNYQLLWHSGLTGIVVPSAFHANEGATGVRRLYLDDLMLKFCYSFENKRKLFEIHSSFKFALICARAGGATSSFKCGFYLHDEEWLFGAQADRSALIYSRELVTKTGGPFLSFLELIDQNDVETVDAAYSHSDTLGDLWDREGQSFSTSEINLSLDDERLIENSSLGIASGTLTKANVELAIARDSFMLAQGKSFWHFDIHFSDDSRLAVPFARLSDRPHWFRIVRYYRVAYRKVASSTNERTLVWALLPPGIVTCESCPSERSPELRPNSRELARLACLNSYVADYLLRLRVAATVNMFMLRLVPVPLTSPHAALFLAHSALRLQAQDEQYLAIWREQLDGAWRESSRELTWPVLPTEDDRWDVRAAVDAVTAEAYGLSRTQYERVLGNFSHKPYPRAPELCLSRFTELRAVGIESFVQKYDPYWDIPLNENLPQPVIDIHRPAAESEAQGTLNLIAGEIPVRNVPVRARPVPCRDDAVEYEHLKRLLLGRDSIGSSEIQSALGFDATHTRVLLKQLVEDGLAVVEGHGRSTRYVSLMSAGGIDGNTTERAD